MTSPFIFPKNKGAGELAIGKKRVLIVASDFYPIISPRSFRTSELAREMARRGHFVKVIIPFLDRVDYDQISNEYGVSFVNLGKLKYKELVLGGPRVVILVKRVISRLLLMLFEYPDIQIIPPIVRALREEDGYDLLISIAVPYPVHWGVAWSRSKNHLIARTWAADCGDPYMGDRIDTFRKLFYFSFIEKWFCRKADYLSIPVKDAVAAYYTEFHDKIRIIPQGYRFDEFKFPPVINNNPIKFAYAGNIVPVTRDPKPFLDYLRTIETDFRFYIYTRKVDLIASYKEQLGEKLVICDYIPRDELLPILASMDFLVNFDNNTNVHSPSKLIDYALTKRPILNIKSEIDKSLIAAFFSRDYSRALVVSDIDQYDITHIADKFLELI